MDNVYRIPTEPIRKQLEEAEKEKERLAAEVAALELKASKQRQMQMELEERRRHMLPPKVWKKRRIRAKMAAKSKARNR